MFKAYSGNLSTKFMEKHFNIGMLSVAFLLLFIIPIAIKERVQSYIKTVEWFEKESLTPMPSLTIWIFLEDLGLFF